MSCSPLGHHKSTRNQKKISCRCNVSHSSILTVICATEKRSLLLWIPIQKCRRRQQLQRQYNSVFKDSCSKYWRTWQFRRPLKAGLPPKVASKQSFYAAFLEVFFLPFCRDNFFPSISPATFFSSKFLHPPSQKSNGLPLSL